MQILGHSRIDLNIDAVPQIKPTSSLPPGTSRARCQCPEQQTRWGLRQAIAYRAGSTEGLVAHVA